MGADIFFFLSLSMFVMKCSLAAIKEQFELGAYNYD